jgi:hypothetical protein
LLRSSASQYGDDITSRLLKAVSLGLRFRFLVLESKSPFRPEKLAFPAEEEVLQTRVTEMLSQMDLILADSTEARLADPDLLTEIFGPDGGADRVKEMMAIWETSRSTLGSAAHEVIIADVPKPTDTSDVVQNKQNAFQQKKELFIESLRLFCQKLEAMNREYTSQALVALSEAINETLGTIGLITGIVPTQGPSSSVVRLTISGRDFRMPRAVLLSRGQERIVASDVLASPSTITANVTLPDAAESDWDLIVQYDNGTDARSSRAFKITQRDIGG